MPDTLRRLTPINFLFCILGLALAGCDSTDRPSDSGTDQVAQNPDTPAGLVPRFEFDARYPVGFSFLNGIREESTGTILAADPLAQVLLRIDADMAGADTLGREGPGPQEYQQPDRVFGLVADTSLLVDLGKAQLTTVLPDGSFGSGIPMFTPQEKGFGEIVHPRFVDRFGNLYFQAGRDRDQGPPDSAAVVRFRRDSATVDTVGMIWLPEANLRRTRRFGFLPKLLEDRDCWAITPDGGLVIRRAQDHLIERVPPDGGRSSGPSHAFSTYPVTAADKEALVSGFHSEAISTVAAANRSGQVTRMSMSRGIPDSGDSPGVDDYEWEEVFPAFRSDRAMVSPTGEIWMERWVPFGSPSQWELFGEEGQWLGSVTFPPRHRLLGFGSTPDGSEAVYMAVADEFDLKWLERHRVVR